MFKFVPPAQIEIDVCDVITGYCQWSRSYDDTVTDVVDGVILSKFWACWHRVNQVSGIVCLIMDAVRDVTLPGSRAMD